MPNKISFSQLSAEVLIVIALAVIAAFLAGLSVGRRIGPVTGPIIIEPVPPVSDITGREPAPIDGGVACTLDAKICPDGSAVGRTGPNCEFFPCPGAVQ